MIRIDSHNHFWQFNPIRDSWIDESMSAIRRDFLPDHLLPILEDSNMDGTIAVQADQSEEETLFLLGLAEKYDFIKGVIGWIDFRTSDIEQKLASNTTHEKLCGFRHIVQSEPDDRFMLREDFVNGLSYLNDLSFTYDILIYQNQLSAVIELVNKLPDQKFVLDHMAKPLIKSGVMEPWASLVKELGSAKNVYCKVSGIITEADHEHWNTDDLWPYLDVVFETFGADRVMFGSDWPVCLLAGSYAKVVQLIEEYMKNFDSVESEKIFGGNAIQFYGLNYGV